MGRCEIGDRVGAIRNSDNDVVYLYGYGTYAEEVPPADPRGKRGMVDFVHAANVTNPKLTMDDGTIVWGAECWWAPEAVIKRRIKGLKVEMVKPEYELES